MLAVRCVDLCKTYRQGDQDIKALDHLSIEIKEGGFVCLSAPSGGGKTTLLNAIGGLDKPDSGEIYVGANAPVLAGQTLAMYFEKPSLRTRVSFEQAMYELGGQSIVIGQHEVQLGKRESVADFAR